MIQCITCQRIDTYKGKYQNDGFCHLKNQFQNLMETRDCANYSLAPMHVIQNRVAMKFGKRMIFDDTGLGRLIW